MKTAKPAPGCGWSLTDKLKTIYYRDFHWLGGRHQANIPPLCHLVSKTSLGHLAEFRHVRSPHCMLEYPLSRPWKRVGEPLSWNLIRTPWSHRCTGLKHWSVVEKSIWFKIRKIVLPNIVGSVGLCLLVPFVPSIAAPGYIARVNACVTSVNQRNANHWLRSIETNTLLW